MGEPFWNLQTAIVNALVNNPSLMAILTGGFYDYVPENTVFPYGRLGAYIETPFNTFGHKGKSIDIQLDAFSRYRGNKELLDIANQFDASLDYQNIVVVNSSFIYMAVTFSNILPEDDNETRHLIRKYTCVLQEG